MIVSFEVKDIGKPDLRNPVVHEANEPLLENLERAYMLHNRLEITKKIKKEKNKGLLKNLIIGSRSLTEHQHKHHLAKS
jgi:hypothetical protein